MLNEKIKYLGGWELNFEDKEAASAFLLTHGVDKKGFNLCGVPLWYQSPEVPVCPITREVMKFVCTINSDNSIEIINKEMSVGLPFSDEYLCFGDYGHLFIFYNPESQIFHANWQW